MYRRKKVFNQNVLYIKQQKLGSLPNSLTNQNLAYDSFACFDTSHVAISQRIDRKKLNKLGLCFAESTKLQQSSTSYQTFLGTEKISASEILAQAVGRRKSAVAEIKIIKGKGDFFINGKPGFAYMQHDSSRLLTIQAPLDILQLQKKYTIIITVQGGGLNGQSQAIKLAIAKALCTIELAYRKSLKLKGYLTTDARCKERKKYGLKKARKAPQFSKR